jgi:hypothetical protein
VEQCHRFPHLESRFGNGTEHLHCHSSLLGGSGCGNPVPGEKGPNVLAFLMGGVCEKSLERFVIRENITPIAVEI